MPGRMLSGVQELLAAENVHSARLKVVAWGASTWDNSWRHSNDQITLAAGNSLLIWGEIDVHSRNDRHRFSIQQGWLIAPLFHRGDGWPVEELISADDSEF